MAYKDLSYIKFNVDPNNIYQISDISGRMHIQDTNIHVTNQ